MGEHSPADTGWRNGLGDVFDHIRLSVEKGTLLFGQHRRRPEARIVDLCAGHRMDPERLAVLSPCGQQEHIVGQCGSNRRGHLCENMSDIERLGHGVQQPVQRVDLLVSERLRAAHRVLLQGQREEIRNTVHQRLVLV